MWFAAERDHSMSDFYTTHEIPFETGPVKFLNGEDQELVRLLRKGYEQQLLDLEVTAVYNPQTNSGAYTFEVILLHKVRRQTLRDSQSPS